MSDDVRSAGDQVSQSEGVESYLQRVADTLRPFYALEQVGDGIYLLRAGEKVTVGKKLTKELLSHGYVVESVHDTSLRVRRIELSDGELVFDR